MNETNLIDIPLYQLKKRMMDGTLSKTIAKSWCLYTEGYNQFAEGITGMTIRYDVYIANDTQGFHSPSDAYVAARKAGIKNVNRKGAPHTDIGALYITRKAYRIEDLLKLPDSMTSLLGEMLLTTPLSIMSSKK